MNPTRKVSKVLVVNEKGDALLLKRSKNDTYRPGDIDFPGGSVDFAESFEIAAQREIQEEAGIDIPLEDIHIAYTMTEHDGEKSIIRVFSIAHIAETPEVVLSEEHEAFWWRKPEEIATEFNHAFYGPAIRYAIKHQLI